VLYKQPGYIITVQLSNRES